MLHTRENLTALYVLSRFLFFSFLFFFFFSFFCYSNRRQPDPMKRKSKIGCIGQESNPDPFFLCVLCCVGICILRYAFSNMCPCCPYIFSACVMLCWDLHITICVFQHVSVLSVHFFLCVLCCVGICII